MKGHFKGEKIHEYLSTTHPDYAWAFWHHSHSQMIADHFCLYKSAIDKNPLLLGQTFTNKNGEKDINPTELAARILKKTIKIQIKNIKL